MYQEETTFTLRFSLEAAFPDEYNGDVVLLVSDDCPKGRLFDQHLGWRKFIKGRLAIHRVGGTHMTMGYGPRSAIIAEHIKSFLGEGT